MACEDCKLNTICYPDLNLRPAGCPEKTAQLNTSRTDPDTDHSENLDVDYGLLSGTDPRRTQAGMRRQHSR